MRFSSGHTRHFKSALLVNQLTDTSVRVNLRPAFHDDGTTWKMEVYDRAVARTWPTGKEHEVGGIDEEHTSWAIEPWLEDLKERQINVLRPHCTLCNGDTSQCNTCVVKHNAAREKLAADLVGRWKSVEDVGYCTISSRSWTQSLDSANIILDDLDVDIRIPVTDVDKRYELDWIQIGASIIFTDVGRAWRGQVSAINIDLSDGFKKVKVKVHDSPNWIPLRAMWPAIEEDEEGGVEENEEEEEWGEDEEGGGWRRRGGGGRGGG